MSATRHHLEVLADDGDVIEVHIHGEIDLSNAPQLKADLAALDPAKPLVIDATALTYLDSAGIHVLEHVLAQKRDCALVIAPTSVVHRAASLAALPLHADPISARTTIAGPTRRTSSTRQTHPHQSAH